MINPKANRDTFRLLISLIICLLLGFFLHAQTLSQADSLYFKSGNYVAASEAYLVLASYWEAEEKMDSAFHKYLYAIKAMGQSNQMIRALSYCEEVLEKMDLYPQANLYRSDIYYEKGYCELVIGDRNKCIETLTKGMVEENKKEQPDSLKLASMLQYKGLALLQSGEVDQGKEIVMKAHQIRLKLLPTDDIELASSANMVYMVFDHLFQYRTADKYIAEAHRIMKKKLEPSHPHYAVVLNNYSNARRNLGDPFRAKELLLEAIASNESSERWYALTMNYYNLADLYFELGEFELSEVWFSQSLEMGDTLLPNPSLERANLYDGLGKIEFQLKHYEKANAFFVLALEQNLQLAGPKSIETAQSYHNLGLLAFVKKDYAAAQEKFKKSILLREQLLSSTHPWTVESRVELGHCLWEQDAKQEAIQLWRTCLHQFQVRLGKQDHRVLSQALQLAKAWEEKNNPDSVRFYLNQTWSGVAPMSDSTNHWLATTSGEINLFHLATVELIDFQLSFWLNHFTFSTTQNDPPLFERTKALIEKFNVFLPKMLPLLNQQQVGVELGQQLQHIYATAALIAHRATPPDLAEASLFFLTCLENSKAFGIRAQLQNRKALSFSKIPDSLELHDQYLQSRIWAMNSLKSETQKMTSELIEMEIEIQKEWHQWQQQLALEYPEYYQLRYQPSSIDVMKVKNDLQRKEQSLLAYFIRDNNLLMVCYDGIQLESKEVLLIEGQLDSIAEFNKLLSQRSFSHRLPKLAHYLYRQFFQPIAHHLSPNILLFPDDALATLSFDLLLSQLPGHLQEYDNSSKDQRVVGQKTTNNFKDYHWLINQYEFQYALHLSSYPKPSSKNQYRLAIAPGFSKDLKSIYEVNMANSGQLDSVFLTWLSTPWSLELVRRFEKEGWGISLTEDQATKANFLRLSANAEIIHFATHAQVNDEQPLKSFLALNPQPKENDDGYLFASDLYSLNLNSKLVVLSACQTGLGQYKSGEGVLSLAHAFQYAGSPSMIYSLWSIDDQQTNWMIDQLYQNLQNTGSVSKALRKAKLDYLQAHDGDLTHPFYWGALLMMGEDHELEQDFLASAKRKLGDFFWIYFVGFLIVMSFLIYFIKKK